LRSSSPRITPELLARYDHAGPRYTSYPTAVEFHEGIDAAEYAHRLSEANLLGEAPVSVYVHLPFCKHRCLFCGCNVIISPHQEKAAPYLELLKREVDLLAERLPDRRSLSQLHLGGGTPTYYRPDQLHEFLGHLLSVFRPTEGAELSVEVDPRVTTRDHVDTFAEFGFNRLSLGVQDFSPKVQEAVERVQSPEETAEIIEHARKRGYTGINIDLIYGLPFQTLETYERTVEEVLRLNPDRVAVYSFAYVPWMRAHMKKMDEEALPSGETKFALFCTARDGFLDACYEAIGMDHFARAADELAVARKEGRLRRNFQGYTVTPAADVLGLGISAIGDVRGAYLQNYKKLSDYKVAVEEGRLPLERGIVRSGDDEIRRDVIHDLMCNFTIDIRHIEQKYEICFEEYFAPDLTELAKHEKEGMVEIGENEIQATPLGGVFVRNLAMCFDRYWRQEHAAGKQPLFSRTV